MTKYPLFRVALTGGIGSGKTTIAEIFARYGVPVIDTDRIARDLVQKGMPALQEITHQFGSAILLPSGELYRAKLRDLVFADPAARERLEAILHPRIFAEVQQRIKSIHTPYCIIVIPLLAESKQAYPRDRILVVDIQPERQIQRMLARDQLTVSQANQILNAQASRETRLALADDVIDNNGAPEALVPQVEALHQRYLKMATAALPH